MDVVGMTAAGAVVVAGDAVVVAAILVAALSAFPRTRLSNGIDHDWVYFGCGDGDIEDVDDDNGAISSIAILADGHVSRLTTVVGDGDASCSGSTTVAAGAPSYSRLTTEVAGGDASYSRSTTVVSGVASCSRSTVVVDDGSPSYSRLTIVVDRGASLLTAAAAVVTFAGVAMSSSPPSPLRSPSLTLTSTSLDRARLDAGGSVDDKEEAP